MKYMLCDIPLSSEQKFGRFKRVGGKFPPMNLLYLGTQLARHGHQVRITTDDYALADVEREMRDFAPDVVGVTFMTMGSPMLPAFAAMARAAAPRAVLIAGGYHASLFPEETLDAHPGISAVFVGEAELSILAFAEMMEQGGPGGGGLAQVPGICHRDQDGQPVRTPPPTPIEDLDSLPFPDFDLIDGYFDKFRGGVNRHFLGTPQAFFLTGRGCPYNCHFCGRKILGSTVRSLSVDYKLELVRWCSEKYGIRSIVYGDEFFTYNAPAAHRFCDELRRRGLDRITWVCSGRVNNLDLDLARALRGAGCLQIGFGCESGSQKILDMINKKTTVERMEKAIRDCHAAGLQVFGNFIIGCPGETTQTLRETYDFIMRNPLGFIVFCYFTPLPGSHFWENRRYLDHGTLVSEDISTYNTFSGLPFVPHGLTEEQMRAFRDKTYRDFYLRFSRLARELRFAVNPNSWKFAARILGLAD